MKMMNDQIAVTPFPVSATTRTVTKGITLAAFNNAMVALTVLIGDGKDFVPGDIVYVRGGLSAHDFAKQVYELPAILPKVVKDDKTTEQQFIVLPKAHVVAVNQLGLRIFASQFTLDGLTPNMNCGVVPHPTTTGTTVSGNNGCGGMGHGVND